MGLGVHRLTAMEISHLRMFHGTHEIVPYDSDGGSPLSNASSFSLEVGENTPSSGIEMQSGDLWEKSLLRQFGKMGRDDGDIDAHLIIPLDATSDRRWKLLVGSY